MSPFIRPIIWELDRTTGGDVVQTEIAALVRWYFSHSSSNSISPLKFVRLSGLHTSTSHLNPHPTARRSGEEALHTLDCFLKKKKNSEANNTPTQTLQYPTVII